MKIVWSIVCSFMFFITISSCSVPQTTPARWIYQKKALTLYAHCDNDLNSYENTPHTLFICIYQLSNPNKFNQLSSDVNGLYEMLDCRLFDSSVVSADNKIVYPGDNIEIHLDRAENAKYVGIVAGYANMSRQRITRLYEIPVEIEKMGFFQKKIIMKPKKLKMHINFGPYSIMTIEESN